MRKELNRRLQKVARKLLLVDRLRKAAVLASTPDEAAVDKLADRSKSVLQSLGGKFTRLSKALAPYLNEEAQKILGVLEDHRMRSVGAAGVVDMDALESLKSESTDLWKQLSKAAQGSSSVLYYFNAFEKFLTVAMLGSRLQNYQLVEQAKKDPRYMDRLSKAMEQMTAQAPHILQSLEKAHSLIPVEAPPETSQESTTDLDAVQNQLNSAEKQMRGVVDQISKVLVAKATELFDDKDMVEVLSDNIMAIYGNGKVAQDLNRDKDFYQDALHLELGESTIDLADFLDSKNKKALYLSYRSFVMAVRALGVMQTARKKAELVLKNKQAQELVVKAQQILQKRKDTIVSYLNSLTKQSTQEKDKVKGIPKGSFSDFFQA